MLTIFNTERSQHSKCNQQKLKRRKQPAISPKVQCQPFKSSSQ